MILTPDEAEMTTWAMTLLAAWNAHDVERLLTFYAPDFEGIDVGQAVLQRGATAAQQRISRYLNAFPDLQVAHDSLLIQGNRVALVWTAQGTHRGELMNIPPTGRRLKVRGMSLLTMTNGKISHAFCMWDVAGLLRGMGLLPEL